MTLRVHISPQASQITDDNGVGRVVWAQYKYLPAHDIELVDDPSGADVIACHIQQGDLPRVDCLHLHGAYFTGDPGSGTYARWHHVANARIMDAARKALAITVPSAWTSMMFKRDMRLTPTVIGHGIDLAEWQPVEQHRGYVLWNKNRAYSDVCSPEAAIALAARGAQVVSTFGPAQADAPPTLQVTGPRSYAEMREMVRHAEVYLATTKETFGIGTLEALAAGVPVLGYAWGGTADLVTHQQTGYLVTPGDVDALFEGLAWIRANRETLSYNAREVAARYDWERVARQYAALYRRVAEQRASESTGVSVVITNYNYGEYVGEAIASVLAQTAPPAEVIVVDDGSTDDSVERIRAFTGDTRPDRPRVEFIAQANQGVAAARNAGIAAATQPCIVCLDADDRLAPDYLRQLRDALTADRGLGVAYTGLGLLHSDGSVTPSAWPPAFDWEAQATPANPPSNCIPCAAMFRRSLWERAGGYKQSYAPAEDTEFFTRGLSVGFTARKVTDEPLFEYRLHAGSASRTKPYRPIDTWHPWMRDKQYPMAAPSTRPPLVRSYSEPAVSVVIPVGPGHAKHLPAALDSLLGQTCRSWEVIVVNDSGELLDLPVYPFVEAIDTMGKTGPANARNIGLDAVRAPLTLFLDADDYLMPTALERMLETYVRSGGKYVYTDWFAINGERVVRDEAPDYSRLGWFERGQHAITALLPTDDARAVDGFDTRLPGWEDWDFFIKLAIRGVCGVRLAEPLLGYRQHTGTVREASLAKKDELLAALRDRYAGYATGEIEMPGCCGGNASALVAAQQAIGNEPLAVAVPDSGVVRMEFVGEQVGAITFFSRDGKRQYRGGNNPLDRYADVPADDAAHLASTGKWRVVERPQPSPASLQARAPAQDAALMKALVGDGTPAPEPDDEPELVIAGDVPERPARRRRR